MVLAKRPIPSAPTRRKSARMRDGGPRLLERAESIARIIPKSWVRRFDLSHERRKVALRSPVRARHFLACRVLRCRCLSIPSDGRAVALERVEFALPPRKPTSSRFVALPVCPRAAGNRADPRRGGRSADGRRRGDAWPPLVEFAVAAPHPLLTSARSFACGLCHHLAGVR